MESLLLDNNRQEEMAVTEVVTADGAVYRVKPLIIRNPRNLFPHHQLVMEEVVVVTARTRGRTKIAQGKLVKAGEEGRKKLTRATSQLERSLASRLV